MKKLFIIMLATIFVVSCSHNVEEDSINEIEDNTSMKVEEEVNSNVEWIEEENLITSSRHHEWVEVDNNWKTIHTFVVYPEVNEKAPVVLLIHENRWLTDWVRETADKVAKEWYIAVAPDLLSSFDENHSRTSDFEDEDKARDALYTLDTESVLSDLVAVENYSKTLTASNGKIASAWFCWGWAKSFELATKSNSLDKALVFYGTPPWSWALDNIKVPIYWFYGGNDNRVNSTIEETEKLMKEKNKTYIYEIYDWAGHAYMRSGEAEDAEEANVKAKDMSWERMKWLLEDMK